MLYFRLSIIHGFVVLPLFPFSSHNLRAAIIALVDRILAAKKRDPAADVAALEREVDERVYRLYGLTKAEIRIVEEAAGGTSAIAKATEGS